MMIHSTDDWKKYMQAALERGWPLDILIQILEKTRNEIQHCADQGTPSKAKAAVRHVVFGMVCTSPKQVRHKSVAANVEHWVTTTRSVIRMHFTMLLTLVLPKIPKMEHLLRSDDHRRELLVEGTRCHDPPVCSLYLYNNRAWSLYRTYL